MITNDGVLTKGGKHLETANTNLLVFQAEPLTAISSTVLRIYEISKLFHKLSSLDLKCRKFSV